VFLALARFVVTSGLRGRFRDAERQDGSFGNVAATETLRGARTNPNATVLVELAVGPLWLRLVGVH
jgi:hypothetical protein